MAKTQNSLSCIPYVYVFVGGFVLKGLGKVSRGDSNVKILESRAKKGWW